MPKTARLGWILISALAAAAAPLRGASDAGFAVAVLVDGAPVPEYAGRGRVYVEALKGKEFSIRLCNPTSGRVAVALSVDGRNVVDAKRTSALAATKWILMPGQQIDIPGWQVSGETSRKFFFTETSRSYARWLGDTSNVGTIEAIFYREKRCEPTLLFKDSPNHDGEVQGGIPAAPSAPSAEKRSRSSAQFEAGVAKSRESDSFAATGIGNRTAFPVQWVAFEEDPVPAASIALRYEFRPELIRLGVLRHADELFARDRASGFEHEYAPDPDRQR